MGGTERTEDVSERNHPENCSIDSALFGIQSTCKVSLDCCQGDFEKGVFEPE